MHAKIKCFTVSFKHSGYRAETRSSLRSRAGCDHTSVQRSRGRLMFASGSKHHSLPVASLSRHCYSWRRSAVESCSRTRVTPVRPPTWRSAAPCTRSSAKPGLSTASLLSAFHWQKRRQRIFIDKLHCKKRVFRNPKSSGNPAATTFGVAKHSIWVFRILTLSPGSVTQSWIGCLVTLGHALNGVMYPWIWCFETPCGVTQPRIECFKALLRLQRC